MRKTLSRILAMVLAVSISLNSLPLYAFATDSDPINPGSAVTETVDAGQATPTPEPSTEPTAEPSTESTVEPTAEPTVEPSAEPTVEPSAEPTVEPTAEPTAEPVKQEVKSVPEQTGYALTKAAPSKNIALFGSDVHGVTSKITSIFGGVAAAGVYPAVVNFLGDTCLPMATVSSTVNDALGYMPSIVYVYAEKHDTENNCDIGTAWNETKQVYETDDYYIFSINETDIKDDNGSEEIFSSWVENIDKTKVVFVISHRPLHERRNDTFNTNNWYKVISKAAETTDIVFLWGHNHYQEATADVNAYYVAKNGDEKLKIAYGDEVTPNFTYVNAGYIDANERTAGNGDVKRRGIVTVAEVTADSIILQDYDQNGKYSGTYNHNVTIPREFAKPAVTLSSIEVTGKTEYRIGDTLALTVTAKYSDGTSKDVTAETTFAGANMNVGGKHTVTAEYEGNTAEIVITVNPMTVTEWDDKGMISVSATYDNLTGLTVTNAYDKPNLSEVFSDYMAVSVTPEGTPEGAEIAYAMEVFSEIPAEDIVLYHVSADGKTLTPISYTLTTSGSGGNYLNFTTNLTGIFAYGLVTVPEGYTLSKIEVSNVVKTEYLVGDNLDMTNPVVTATYTKTGADDFTRILYIKDDYATTDGYTIGGYDMTVAGEQTVTVSYGGKTATFAIKVWAKEITENGITISVGEGEHGLTGVTVKDSANKNVENAIKDLITGEYKAYDISLVFADGYSANDSEKTVTLPIPAGVTNPAVYYVSDDGKAEEMPVVDKDETTVTFTTTHFSTYAVGDRAITEPEQPSGGWVTIKEPSGGTTTYTYTQATSITAGGKYVIVANNQAVALMDNNGSMGKQSVTISGTTMTSTTALTEWTFSGSSSGTIYNGTRYLRYNNGFSLNKNSSTLTFTDNGSNFGIYSEATWFLDSDHYFYYNGSSWTSSSSAQHVRLYQLTDTTTTGGTGGLYGNISGELTYEVPVGTSREEALAIVKSGIAVFYHEGNASNAKKYEDDGAGVSWTLDSAYNGTTPGEYDVTISYNNVELGTAKVVVSTRKVLEVTIDKVAGEVRQGAGQSSTTGGKITITYEDGGQPTVVPVTVSMLSKDGKSISTATPGEQTGLKVTYVVNDQTYTFDFTLTVKGKVLNNYPEYPDEGSVKVNKTATGINFQSTGLAQIEISASGIPLRKGVDLIVMLDTSSSMNSNRVDQNNDGTVSNSEPTRLAVLQDALTELIKDLKKPDESGLPKDIKIAIADFNGYYGDGLTNATGWTGTPYDRDGDDTLKYYSQGIYNQKSQAIVYTNRKNNDKGSLTESAFVPISSFGDIAEGEKYYELNYVSGTNYDYAFDAIYQLGTIARNRAKADGEERDLFVVFMSDGASLQWNYFASPNNGGNGAPTGENFEWNSWLAGKYTTEEQVKAVLRNNNSHGYYYDLVDHDGDGQYNEHRMANAIKGNPDDRFEIIRKSKASDSGLMDDEGRMIAVEGKDDMYTVPGLGAKMFTINFDARTDGQIQIGNIEKALKSTASDQTGSVQYYYKVHTVDELDAAFSAIGAEVAFAAENARFVDQMGENFDLKLGAFKDLDGQDVIIDGKKVENKIEIISYDIYKENDTIPAGKNIGDRKGTFTVLETVTFNEDGTEAYSNLIGDGINILAKETKDGKEKGVIYAQTFYFNTNNEPVSITGVNIPTGIDKATNLTTGSVTQLPAETFYWKLGTVNSSELAMRYYVYLEDSMEGKRPSGSYNTNEYAVLYYDNYLGKPCYKDTISPTIGWKAANISYAFYLVNEKGEIVVNQTTGQTGTFANKIAVTAPVVYQQILLNNDNLDPTTNGTTFIPLSVIAESPNVLPKYYELYDEGSSYSIIVKSDNTGSWEIGKTTGKKDTTYVTNFSGNQYSNNPKESTVGYDYTHTVVWFAVLWKPQPHPDTVVIDYGLPVDINVLTNDMFGENGSLYAIADRDAIPTFEGKPVEYTDTIATRFALSCETKYGFATADVKNGRVKYTPKKSMEMNGYDVFAYAVYFNDPEAEVSGYYYDTVTVIPATTIYYEDDFVSLKSYTWNDGWVEITDINDNRYVWSQEGETVYGEQEEDRPGKYSLTDANNIYGFDSVNKSMSTYSMGSAMKATVDYDNYGLAEFDFYGTGFDVVSVTSNTTGVIYVDVYQNETLLNDYSFIVDSYYGYHKVPGDANNDGIIAEGEMIWEANSKAENAIYQVPVMQVNGLPYGRYTAKITAFYSPDYDNVEDSKDYEFYLDAIRIYNPAGTTYGDGQNATDIDKVVQDAYKTDGEAWPSYIELRDNLITANSFGNYGGENDTVKITGAVFIDGDPSVGTTDISDYISYGPNNEVYLASGQSIAFILSDVTTNVNNKTESIVSNVHLGAKSANGEKVEYTIANITEKDKVVNNETIKDEDGKVVKEVVRFNEKTRTADTTTDMYYDITAWRNDIIVITNTSTSGILSLTNIKATYTEDPNDGKVASDDGIEIASVEGETIEEPNLVRMYMTPAAAALTLRSMNAPTVEEQPTPEVTPEPTPEVTPDPEETPEPTPEVTPTPEPEEDEKPGNNKPEKPSKPDKDEKPGNNKPEKPSKPEKEEKPGDNKPEKPSKPGKGEDKNNNSKPSKPAKENEKPNDSNKPSNGNNTTTVINNVINTVINFVSNLLNNIFRW